MAVYSALFTVTSALLLVVSLPLKASGSRKASPGHWDPFIQSPSDEEENRGTRWAILVAGSNGFDNYRHQVQSPSAILFFSCGSLIYSSSCHNLHFLAKPR